MRFKAVIASLQRANATRTLLDAINLVVPDGCLHVIRTLPRRAPSEEAEVELQDTLDELRSLVIEFSAPATTFLHVRRGERAEETVRLGIECHADLIVVGAASAPTARIASSIVSWSVCSVLVVEPHRERHEAEGLVPRFPLCPACDETRAASAQRDWYCAPHDDRTQRLFAAPAATLRASSSLAARSRP